MLSEYLCVSVCEYQICVCPEEFYGGKYSQGWEARGWVVNIGCQCHGKCALSPRV